MVKAPEKKIGTPQEQSQNHYADCCSQNCVYSMTSQESAGPNNSSFEQTKPDSHGQEQRQGIQKEIAITCTGAKQTLH